MSNEEDRNVYKNAHKMLKEYFQGAHFQILQSRAHTNSPLAQPTRLPSGWIADTMSKAKVIVGGGVVMLAAVFMTTITVFYGAK